MADSTTFSQNKQFLTLVWVFGLWQLISMLTVKLYGCKMPFSVILKKIVAVKDNEMSQIRIPITQLWDVYIIGVLHNKELNDGIAACYETCFMNTLNHENWSPWIKLSCLPAPFYIPFILMYFKKTSILQLQMAKSMK